MKRLQNKIALITGANAGIGEATAKLFASEGATVVLMARRQDKLEAVAASIREAGGEALAVQGDVTSRDDCERVISTVMDTYKRIDVLVNNAGIADQLWGAARCSDELWDRCVAVNQTAIFTLCQLVAPHLEKQNSGSVVNISSIGGVFCTAGAAYSASKRAVLGMTKNLAIKFIGTGVRVNAVCPGPTETDMFLKMEEPEDKRMLNAVQRRGDTSAGLSSPEDIARAIMFFASDDSAAVTGQHLVVNHGMLL